MATDALQIINPSTVTASGGVARNVPWQIWVVVVMLGLEGVGNLLAIPQQPAAAGWAAAKVLFIAGLIGGWRWVFVLFLAVTALHVVAFGTVAPVVAAMNLLIMVLVASAFRHFFPRNGRGNVGPDGRSIRVAHSSTTT